MRRRVGGALAAAGYVEVLNYPFISERDLDALQLTADESRRAALRLANPLSEDEPLLRTTLLPGLLRALARNAGRGFPDVALYEMGLVYRPTPHGAARRRGRRSTAARRPTRSPRSRRPCRTSRCASRSCSPATANPPAGGARAGRRAGRTRSRPPGSSPPRRASS